MSLRIEGGECKGLKLHLPSREVRPTQAKVRKSIMNHLAAHGKLEGAIFWDLFAGSGVMGLEALSWGADGGCFVEKNFQALKILQKNVEVFSKRKKARIQISSNSVENFLEKDFSLPDILWADPPYGESLQWLNFFYEKLQKKLSEKKTTFLFEGSHESFQNWPYLDKGRYQRYGGTGVWITEI